MKQEIARDASRDRIKTKLSGISFSEIPGQSALFTKYLADPFSLKSYYPNVVESPIDIAGYIPTALAEYETDRDALCNSLVEINAVLGSGSETMANIELLRRDDVTAVVTGQQAGLFGGPLYTIYKALSAIRLSEELTAKGQRTVPVFWMATEDHDLEEVSTTYFLTRAAELHRAHYYPRTYKENSPVGNVEIDGDISLVIDELFAQLPPSAFTSDAHTLLDSSWRKGINLGRAFGETIANLTSRYGLIMLDPLDPALKRLSSPVYVQAVERSDEIAARIIRRNRELEEDGFHSQVLVDENYFPLFWHDDNGGRNPLRKVALGFYGTKGQKRQFSVDELHKMAEAAPERLSPGVMLRPVVQDHLLPTAAYFGGGAEISYFAQNSVVYESLGRPVTPIFHRQSFTILEPKFAKTIRKLGLKNSDLFKNREAAILDWAKENIDLETAGVFSSAEETINTELNRIDRRLALIDPTLLDNLAKRRRKMLYHISAVRKKTLLALSRKNGNAERLITELYSIVMPNGHLQERSINVFSFISKYGPDFVELLYKAVDLNDKRHRILEISNE